MGLTGYLPLIIFLVEGITVVQCASRDLSKTKTNIWEYSFSLAEFYGVRTDCMGKAGTMQVEIFAVCIVWVIKGVILVNLGCVGFGV